MVETYYTYGFDEINLEIGEKKVNNGKLKVETYGFDEINLQIGEKNGEPRYQNKLLWSNNKNIKVLKLEVGKKNEKKKIIYISVFFFYFFSFFLL